MRLLFRLPDNGGQRRRGPVHPKAIPVILTTSDEVDRWLEANTANALALQRPLSDDALWFVARGERADSGVLRQQGRYDAHGGKHGNSTADRLRRPHGHPSKPGLSAGAAPIGARCMATKPLRSKYSTRRFATISAMISSVL
jgi:hypothetical protein